MRGKGFTLVELLVTISILAVLMTLALISYQNIQKNARDARRKSDIVSIQSALEQYHSDQGYYPASLPVGSLQNPGLTKKYMAVIPTEAQTGAAYSYNAQPGGCDNAAVATFCTNYCLYANLEISSNAVNVPNCGAVTTPPSRPTFEGQAP